MSPQKELFRYYQLLETPRVIILGDNRSHNALGYGFSMLKIPTGEYLLIPDVLYVHGLTKSLLSINQITTTCNTIITFT